MSITFNIRVMGENEEPISGAEVTVGDGWGAAGQTYDGFTDEDGWAEIEIYNVSSFTVKSVSVSKGANHLGTVRCDETVEDGDSCSVTIPDA